MKLASDHINLGKIQAYLDEQLGAEKNAGLERHLADCPRCHSRLELARHKQYLVKSALSRLEIEPDQHHPPAAQIGIARLASRVNSKKELIPMKSTIFSRVPRPVWAALTLVAVLAVALTFEPVRVLANSFLALFRVEQIQVIQFDSDQMSNRLQNSSNLEYMLSNEVQVEELGAHQEVHSADEASALAGFQIKLPSIFEPPEKFDIQPGAKMAFTVNLELVRGVLQDLEREDIQLPDNLDGAVIQMELPTSVATYFGDCLIKHPEQVDPDQEPEPIELRGSDCNTLLQVPSPIVSGPPDLDLTKIGEAYLQVLGMDAQEAAAFSRNVNWASTFVVPIPRYYTDYEEVDVGGSPGTLIHDKEGFRDSYILIWINDGVIYALNGQGDTPSALEIASSIR